MSDPYVYEGTNVLINKFGIKIEREYQLRETAYSNIRSIELEKSPIKGNLGFDQLKSIHGYLFQDVWDWAGESRTVNIAKNEMFAMPQYIDSFANNTFNDLQKRNYLQGLDKSDFTKQVADVLGDINAMHPFREGNGRTQRTFISQLANNAGYFIDWRKVGEKEMINASVHSMNIDNTEFKSMFDRITVLVELDYKHKDSTNDAPDSSKSNKSTNLIDEAVDKADEAAKAVKAARVTKAGKLGLVTSVGLTAVVAGLIYEAHEKQRESAELFLKADALKPNAYKEYIELNKSVEKIMHAENIAGQ